MSYIILVKEVSHSLRRDLFTYHSLPTNDEMEATPDEERTIDVMNLKHNRLNSVDWLTTEVISVMNTIHKSGKARNFIIRIKLNNQFDAELFQQILWRKFDHQWRSYEATSEETPEVTIQTPNPEMTGPEWLQTLQLSKDTPLFPSSVHIFMIEPDTLFDDIVLGKDNNAIREFYENIDPTGVKTIYPMDVSHPKSLSLEKHLFALCRPIMHQVHVHVHLYLQKYSSLQAVRRTLAVFIKHNLADGQKHSVLSINVHTDAYVDHKFVGRKITELYRR